MERASSVASTVHMAGAARHAPSKPERNAGGTIPSPQGPIRIQAGGDASSLHVPRVTEQRMAEDSNLTLDSSAGRLAGGDRSSRYHHPERSAEGTIPNRSAIHPPSKRGRRRRRITLQEAEGGGHDPQPRMAIHPVSSRCRRRPSVHLPIHDEFKYNKSRRWAGSGHRSACGRLSPRAQQCRAARGRRRTAG